MLTLFRCGSSCLEGQDSAEEVVPTVDYAPTAGDSDGLNADGCFAFGGKVCKRRSCKPGGCHDSDGAGTDDEESGYPLDGWRPLDKAFYAGGGETFENGDVEPRGAAIQILGDDDWRQGCLRVRFPGSLTPTSVPAEALSRRPVPLRGGWRSLQLACLKKSPADTSKATPGLLVKVIGDDPSRAGMLVVQIAGSSALITADPSSLVEEKVELPGGWRPLDRAYYTGHGESFENGDTEPHGAAVVVLGRDSGWPGMLRVKFPHSRSPTAVDPLELSRDAVQLSGGWLSLDTAYYAGTQVEVIGDDPACPGLLTLRLPDSGAIIVVDPVRLARPDAAYKAEPGSGECFPTSSAASTAVTPQAIGGKL